MLASVYCIPVLHIACGEWHRLADEDLFDFRNFPHSCILHIVFHLCIMGVIPASSVQFAQTQYRRWLISDLFVNCSYVVSCAFPSPEGFSFYAIWKMWNKVVSFQTADDILSSTKHKVRTVWWICAGWRRVAFEVEKTMEDFELMNVKCICT